MLKFSKIIRNGLILGCLATSTAWANYSLVNDQSSVHFISTKKEHISELHHFNQISGQLDKSGQFNLSIQLASVETGIDIRNERMREHLFKVDNFPAASLTAQLPSKVMKLENGKSIQLSLTTQLTLVNKTLPLKISVQVTKTSDGYIASSIHPVLLSAKDFDLTTGIQTLQKLAGLPSIGFTVPVSFNLHLKQD